MMRRCCKVWIRCHLHLQALPTNYRRDCRIIYACMTMTSTKRLCLLTCEILQLSTDWTFTVVDSTTFTFGHFGDILVNTQQETQDDKGHRLSPHLSHHAIPGPVDLLAVFAVSDQVEVVGELDWLGDLLQDVNAETFTATLDVDPWLLCLITAQTDEQIII